MGLRIIETNLITINYLAADGNNYEIEINIPDEALVPVGSNLHVTEISDLATDENGDNYVEKAAEVLGVDNVGYVKLLDIYIEKDGEKVQPKVPVSVKVKLSDMDADATAQVVHFGEKGAEEVNSSVDGGVVEFEAPGFSIYAVIEGGEDPTIRATYIFQNADGSSYTFIDSVGNTVDNQIIKNGEYLEDVGRPNVEPGETFSGWYVYNTEDGTYGDHIQFGAEYPITVTANTTYYVRPVFGDVAYVNFFEDSEGTNIYQRLQVALADGSATYDISNQSVTAPKSNLAFMGWSTQPGTDNDDRTVITNTNVTITEDTNFYPVYKSAHWIHFNANPDGETGASYTAPKFVLLGQTAASAKPANPTWKGHSFRYWSETKPVYNENGVLQNNPPEFNFNQTLDDREGDVELYAVWANADTTYTVIFWKQRITDDKNASDAEKTFDYAGQETETATSGTTVNASDYENQYTGFTVNGTKSDTSITVKADGSSVLNVYFDRKLMTFKFYRNGNNTSDPGYNSTYWNTTTDTQRVTVWTGLYGQPTSKYGYSWPAGSWNFYTAAGGTSGMTFMGQFVLPNAGTRVPGGQEVRFYYTGSADADYEFYLENPDGTYTLSDTGHGGNGTFTFANKYDGYTVSQYRRYDENYYGGRTYQNNGWQNTSAGSSVSMNNWDGIEIRYQLSTHKIKYLDPTDNTELTNVTFTNTGANPVSRGVGNVKYTASLTNYQPPASVVPVSQSPGKVWDGKWYADQACTVEFDWSQTMPNDDVRVFAGWTDEWYRVEIDPNGGELSSTESTYFWSKYGGKVQQYNDITRNYVEDPSGEYYYLINSWDPSWPDSADGDPAAARIAKYSTSSSETIGEVTINNDGKKYSFKQDAYSLVGWYRVNEDGSLGDPYDFSEEITANVKIRAIWRMVGEFKVVYDVDAVDESGNPLYKEDASGQPTTERVQATSVPTDSNSYADKSETNTLGKAGDPEGYVFQGWYYNGKIYNPGDVLTVLAELADDEDKVHLQPVYIPYDQVPVRNTHIYWYTNTKDINGNTITTDLIKTVETTADADHIDWGEYYAQPNLQLNANVPILGNGTYAYEGYEFIGWAKSADATTPWLAYDSETGKFSENGVVVDYVAADEKLPYEDLFALWDVKKYTVTITKTVSSDLDTDQNIGFVFTPEFSDSYSEHNSNFTLAGTETTVTAEDGTTYTLKTSQTFEDVPYGTTLVLTESLGDYDGLFNVTVKKTVTTDVNGDAIVDPQPVDSSNGATYTIEGDVTIAYTNTRKTTDVTIKKVLENTFIKETSGVDFFFTADWGQTTPASVRVNTATDTDGKVINNVPVGVEMVITEATDTAYVYTVSAAGASTEDKDATASSYTFDVPANGETVTFTNTVETTSGIAVNKTDDQTPANGLKGATFQFLRNNKLEGDGTYVEIGGTFNGGITSGDNGVMITASDELPIGYYKLKELTTPDGYIITNAEVEFQVLKDGEGHTMIALKGSPSNASVSADGKTLIITNEKGVELPHTGGPGTLIYTLSGLILLTGSVIGLSMRRRERRCN